MSSVSTRPTQVRKVVLAAACSLAVLTYIQRLGWEVTMFLIFGCSYALACLCWLRVDATKPLVPKHLPAG